MHFLKFFFLVRRELDLPTNNPNWSAFRQNSDTHNCHHHLPCHCTDHIIRLEIINSMKTVEFLVEKRRGNLIRRKMQLSPNRSSSSTFDLERKVDNHHHKCQNQQYHRDYHDHHPPHRFHNFSESGKLPGIPPSPEYIWLSKERQRKRF